MRANRSEGSDFPEFEVVPILVHYGGDDVPSGYGWRPYKCPFHGDRDASGSVNTQKQVFNCHAADCPKGNAVQIIMQHERLSYSEAVTRAIEIIGEVDSGTPSTKRRSQGGGRGSRSGARTFRRTWG